MNTIATALAKNVTGVQGTDLVPREYRFSLDEVPDLSGKVAVVTGGTEGIGSAVSHVLLANHIEKLFVVSKDEKIYSEFADNISASLGAGFVQRLVWKACDLASPKSVVGLAGEISSETDRLHILANVAGRGVMPYALSDDGIEMDMATNHFGHAVLVSGLLPLLKKTAETDVVRIVSTSSRSHESAPTNPKFESLDEINTDHGPNQQYGQSKLANILHVRWLAARLQAYPKILVNASNPGVVETRQPTEHLLDAYPLAGRLLQALRPAMKGVFEGCVSTVWCATRAKQSGQYVSVPKVVEEGSRESRDMSLADNLMRLTKRVLQERAGIVLEDP